eukprot:c13649_g1_i1.p1 GENE.c13649_g1_i1~~c13649_g1_i1.p1  ORF type:complete len:213 (+),score=77.38 c13649_g1_i1:35-673(+)
MSRVLIFGVFIVSIFTIFGTPILSKESSSSHIKQFDFAKGTLSDTKIPKVQLLQSVLEQPIVPNLLEIDEGKNTNNGALVFDETVSKKSEIINSLPAAIQHSANAVDPFSEDPWSIYGGKNALFCRIQYYHDTVEYSPECQLQKYDQIPAEFHSDRYNCQFFEQRGILYFYGEKWMDCTPLSQRDTKVVMECGLQCAPRKAANAFAKARKQI